jgi:hypothetical protein
MPKSYKWFLSFSVPNQNSVYSSVLSHVCHIPHPSHPPSLHRPNNICRGAPIIKGLTVLLFPESCYFIPLRSKCSPQYPVLQCSQPILFLNTADQNNRKKVQFCIL